MRYHAVDANGRRALLSPLPLASVTEATSDTRIHEPPLDSMEPQQYNRPINGSPLSPLEKQELLQEYFLHYECIAKNNPSLLNAKLERAAVAEILDQVGGLLLERSQQLACSSGQVRKFLDATAPPDSVRARLPDDFRAFCLLLNALKQWVAAESAATDRYLLGGTARKQCRQMADHCLVTGQPLNDTDVELHHPTRDGRPPIPLSKAGHDRIEFVTRDPADPIEVALRKLKRQGNRSWVMLRRGCVALDGGEADDSTPAVLATSKTFARKAAEATGLSYLELIEWLDQHESPR